MSQSALHFGRNREFCWSNPLSDAEEDSQGRDQMAAAPLIAIMGVVCATTLFISLGFVIPVSSAVGDLFDLLAVASRLIPLTQGDL